MSCKQVRKYPTRGGPIEAHTGQHTTTVHQVLKTFIVEDSQVIRDSLVATLEELTPVKVVGSCETETSAVRWLGDTNHPVDLVIVDIFLKNGSGLGVLRATQKLQGARSIVVLSNYATEDIRRKCLELGAHQVFDKSNEIDALIAYCNALPQNANPEDAP